jgi:hypothetical protein
MVSIGNLEIEGTDEGNRKGNMHAVQRGRQYAAYSYYV